MPFFFVSLNSHLCFYMRHWNLVDAIKLLSVSLCFLQIVFISTKPIILLYISAKSLIRYIYASTAEQIRNHSVDFKCRIRLDFC